MILGVLNINKNAKIVEKIISIFGTIIIYFEFILIIHVLIK